MWLVALVGVVVGWSLHLLYQEWTPSPSMPGTTLPAPAGSIPTFPASVQSIWTCPTESVLWICQPITATPDPTEIPTAMTVTINDCGTATPGAVCIAAPLPSKTPTPVASCYGPTPEVICRWPTEVP